jgi:hypothetical protein
LLENSKISNGDQKQLTENNVKKSVVEKKGKSPITSQKIKKKNN